MKNNIIIPKANKMIVRTYIIFFLFVFSNELKAQVKIQEINELQGLFNAHEHTLKKYKGKKDKPKNEVEFMMASGFNIYKRFFSSQDNPSCVFYPSCSEYSVQAFQQKGLLLGTLYTFDRLSRCHRLVKTGQYYYDPQKQRFYDPVH